jgi:hypothetical protein
MIGSLKLMVIPAITALAIFAAADAALAQDTRQHVTAGAVDIYYGFLPAEVAGRRTSAHDAAPMHGGARKGDYHLMIALYDKGGERITDANVRATVGELGMAGARKTLEPMVIGDTITFGNYFPMRSQAQYRIAIEIRLPRAARPIEARIDYQHR